MDETKPRECESCGYKTKLGVYPRMGSEGSIYVCALCAATAGILVARHAPSVRDHAELIRTICYTGNAILDAIRRGQGR